MIPDPGRRYIENVLALYRSTPGTRGRSRPADRRLAQALFDRNVPLTTVRHALLLTIARRITRPTDAPPLTPVASLHYFLPVVDELLLQPLDHGYVTYLQQTIQRNQQQIPQQP